MSQNDLVLSHSACRLTSELRNGGGDEGGGSGGDGSCRSMDEAVTVGEVVAAEVAAGQIFHREFDDCFLVSTGD